MNTVMTDNAAPAKKVTRKGSGRTKGAYSFVLLSVAEIQAKLADPNQKFPVGRKWAESLGFQDLVAKPATNTMNAIEGTTPESKVAVKIRDLNDED